MESVSFLLAWAQKIRLDRRPRIRSILTKTMANLPTR
jgi:hypothetical protein